MSGPPPERVAALFEALADLAPAEAERRLAEQAGGDLPLRQAVQRLLTHDRAAAPGFLAPRPGLLAEVLRDQDPAQAGAADEPLAGAARLGRYCVLHKLAEGGMGVISVGYDDSLNRRVAFKVLRRGDAAREWLLREGQALGRLSHPNVVSIHEVGAHEGRVFLAMELIEGPTLRTWLDAAPRAFAATLRLFLQAGRGLATAHHAGLVHRDFKPENVLIGPDGRARVVDFGIVALARAATMEVPAAAPAAPAEDASALSSPLTQTGALVGTPAYMSPEQLRGERATPTSDQYSFCVALYCAAYGAAPHPATELPQLAAGKLTVRLAPCAPGSILKAVVAQYQPLIQENELALEVAVPTGLPAVQADHARAQQILENLLENAIKFTPEGGRITLRIEEVAGEVRFAVSDSGPGIAKEHQAALFTPFWQAQPADQPTAALGLSVARGLAEAQGGRLWVESEEGRGAIFFFTLKTRGGP